MRSVPPGHVRALVHPKQAVGVGGTNGERHVVGSLLLCALLIATTPALAGSAVSAPRIGGRLDAYGVVAVDGPSPSQRPLARLDLSVEQNLSRKVSWFLSLTGRWGGPPRGADAGAFALDRSFQNFSPSLEFGESYLDYRGDRVDLRLGLQKFFWGQLDSIQPNDLLSPREYEDPFLTDAADAKIAVPALSATWYPEVPEAARRWLDEPALTAVWQPIVVPWRFPLLGERWYPPTGTAAPFLDVSAGQLPGCPCRVAIEQETVNAAAPARRFDDGNIALRFAARLWDVDWSLMFWNGYDTQPAFDVPIRLQLAPGGPGEPASGVAQTQIRPAYRRFQAIGTDFAFAAGRFTVRGEANWRWRKPYSMDLSDVADRVLADPARRDALVAGQTIVEPAYVQRDSLAWGLGVDTVVEGALAIFEVYQLVLPDNDTPLLIQNVDTRLAANVSRGFLRERLEVELIAIWGIESAYELVRGTIRYDLMDRLELRVGALGIWGRERSLVGQFRRNSELFGGVRYHF